MPLAPPLPPQGVHSFEWTNLYKFVASAGMDRKVRKAHRPLPRPPGPHGLP